MYRNYHRIKKIQDEAIKNVSTFVATTKTAVVKFRTTDELKCWLIENYNGKMSAYIESLIYADLRMRGIDLYKAKKPITYLSDEDLE